MSVPLQLAFQVARPRAPASRPCPRHELPPLQDLVWPVAACANQTRAEVPQHHDGAASTMLRGPFPACPSSCRCSLLPPWPCSTPPPRPQAKGTGVPLLLPLLVPDACLPPPVARGEPRVRASATYDAKRPATPVLHSLTRPYAASRSTERTGKRLADGVVDHMDGAQQLLEEMPAR